MLKESGASLFEILVVMTMTALLLISTARFIPRICGRFFDFYHRQQIKYITHRTMWPLIKDIKRAVYLGQENKDIHSVLNKRDCVVIGYGSPQKGSLRDDNEESGQLVFVYRFKKNNIEVATQKTNSRYQNRWYKLFNPSEVTVTAFNVFDHKRYAEIFLTVSLKRDPRISYTLLQTVKYENR